MAGGDNCGVYLSEDNGLSWTLYSEGLETTDLTESLSVDDLLFVGEQSGAATAYQGVYAATRGGIYFKADNASRWVLLTDHADPKYRYDYYMRNDSCEILVVQGLQGSPIPFSTLAYDPVEKVIYAGTGHGRWPIDSCDDIYPEAAIDPPGTAQYSIWKYDVADSTVTPAWEHVSNSEDRGIVTQIAVVEVNGTTEVAYACRTGLYNVPSAAKAIEPHDLLTGYASALEELGWSIKPWGVAAGSDGYLYLQSETYPDDPDRKPGIFRRNLTDGADPQFYFVGDPYQTIPPRSTSWDTLLDIAPVGDDEHSGVTSLTVVPGSTMAEDVVYVGVRTTSNNADGYYRYAEDATQPDWIQIIGRGAPGLPQFQCDWNNTTTSILETGWFSGRHLGSLAPLVFSPADPQFMFALGYHNPLFSEDSGRTWTQRYTTGSDAAGWSSNGLNIFNVYTSAVQPDGALIFAGADIGAFRTVITTNPTFEWLHASGANGWPDIVDVATNATGEILAVRRNPLEVTVGPLELCSVMRYRGLGLGDNEAEWETVSSSMADHTGVPIQVTDLEFFDDGNLYACVYGVPVSNHSEDYGRVFVATPTGNFENWSPVDPFSESAVLEAIGRYNWFSKIKQIPDTRYYLVAAKMAGGDSSLAGGLFCFNLDDPEFFQEWLAGGDTTPGSVLEAAGWSVAEIEVSADGRFVYAGTQSDWDRAGRDRGAGTIVRFELPATGFDGSSVPVGVALANADMGNAAGEFGYPAPSEDFHYYIDNLIFPSAWTHTQVHDIESDPHNPRRIYVALGERGLHPSNGVWSYDPLRSEGSQWVHEVGMGTSLGDAGPGMMATVARIDPNDLTKLFVGTQGQELFTTAITPSPAPTIATSAIYTLPPGGGPSSVLAVRVESTSGLPITQVFADVRSMEGADGNLRLLMDDSGPGGESGIDHVAGDGIWSAEVNAEAIGSYEVSVVARDEAWNTGIEQVTVHVIEVTHTFVDHSGETNALATGITSQPLVAMPINANGDDLVDLVVTEVGDKGKYFEAAVLGTEVPGFIDETSTIFPGLNDRPPLNTTAAVTADFDNDGHEDFFTCHDTTPRLYRWNPAAGDNGQHERVTSDVMSVVPDHAYAAAWADYNCDGWIDLAIVGDFDEPLPPIPGIGDDNIHIYKNTAGHLELTQVVLVPNSAAKTTPLYNVIWADLDVDGRPELLASDANIVDGEIVVYTVAEFIPEVLDHHFVDVTSSWFGAPGSPPGVRQLVPLDYDNDGDPDLVIARSGMSDNLLFYENLGSQFIEVDKSTWSVGTYPDGLNGVVVGDVDLDGSVDLITAPAYATTPPRLLTNLCRQGLGYVTGAATDLPSGAVFGGLAFDWLGGKPNVYLAKSPESAGADVEQFFYGYEPVDGAPPNNHIRLKVGTSGLTNATGIGARFEIEWAGNHSYRWVSGGGGGGSQSAPDLVFGVGSYSGPVTVQVLWPNGSVTTGAVWTTPWEVPGYNVAFPVPYTGLGIVIDEASIESQYLVGPDDNWLIFEWDADQMALPEVMFYRNDAANASGCRCMSDSPSGVALNANTTNVETEITQTAEFTYHYKVTWRDRCCYPRCTYEYDVRNILNGMSTTSNMQQYRTPKICVGNPPQN